MVKKNRLITSLTLATRRRRQLPPKEPPTKSPDHKNKKSPLNDPERDAVSNSSKSLRQ